jgi:hypothetical protein
MKNHAIVWIAVLCASLYGDDTRLSPRFRTVFILEMSNSFDQFLANRLTSTHVLWVVSDPKSADAVLTEAVDEPFWTWVQHAYSGTPDTSAGDGGRPIGPTRTSVSSTSNRGTVFLVDPRRRVVLWSAWELPRNSSPAESDRSAMRVTNQLKTAFGRK